MAEAVSGQMSEEDLFASRRGLRSVLEKLGWLAMVSLLLVGLSSVFGRMVFMGDAQGVANPEKVYNAFDIRYVQLPLATWLHLLPALLIALTGPFQFIRTIRKRWRPWHRISGRIYIVCGLIGALSGLYIGGLNPFGGLNGPGFNEAMATFVISGLTIWFLIQAYRSVRRKQFVQHREWIMRSWTVMLGIATERLLLGTLMATTDVGIEVLFGATFWMALVINLAGAELWIHLTRTPGRGLAHWKDLDEKAAVAT